MAILGIDYGRVHVGLAIGHLETGVAVPLRTFNGLPRQALFEEIREIVKSHDITQLAIGLPYRLTGPGDNQIMAEAREFGKQCAVFCERPVEFVDERFTSAAARRLLSSFPQADEHSVAAMCLLQTYLDIKAGQLNRPGN